MLVKTSIPTHTYTQPIENLSKCKCSKYTFLSVTNHCNICLVPPTPTPGDQFSQCEVADVKLHLQSSLPQLCQLQSTLCPPQYEPGKQRCHCLSSGFGSRLSLKPIVGMCTAQGTIGLCMKREVGHTHLLPYLLPLVCLSYSSVMFFRYGPPICYFVILHKRLLPEASQSNAR